MLSLLLFLLQILHSTGLHCYHMNKSGASKLVPCRGYCASISAVVSDNHLAEVNYCIPDRTCLAVLDGRELANMGNLICRGLIDSTDPGSITQCRAAVCQRDGCNNYNFVSATRFNDCQINQCNQASCHDTNIDSSTTPMLPTSPFTGLMESTERTTHSTPFKSSDSSTSVSSTQRNDVTTKSATIKDGTTVKQGTTMPPTIVDTGDTVAPTTHTALETASETITEPETTTESATEIETESASDTPKQTLEPITYKPETTESITTEPQTTKPAVTTQLSHDTTKPPTTEPAVTTKSQTTEPAVTTTPETSTPPKTIPEDPKTDAPDTPEWPETLKPTPTTHVTADSESDVVTLLPPAASTDPFGELIVGGTDGPSSTEGPASTSPQGELSTTNLVFPTTVTFVEEETQSLTSSGMTEGTTTPSSVTEDRSKFVHPGVTINEVEGAAYNSGVISDSGLNEVGNPRALKDANSSAPTGSTVSVELSLLLFFLLLCSL